MKQYFFYTLLFLTFLTSCQDDFDELKDSSLRHITFTIDTHNLFGNVLTVKYGNYAFDTTDTIDSAYRLRINAYCYNPSDNSLLQHQTLLCHSLSEVKQATFSHLDKRTDYLFVLLADVVKYDSYLGYYETWFQIDSHNLDAFYFFSDSRNEQPQHDVIYSAFITTKPTNQEVDVHLEPLTYNGYLVLEHTDSADRLTGHVAYVNAFMLKNRSWTKRSSQAYEYTYYRPSENQIIMPLNLSYADSVVNVKVKRTNLTGTDSTTVDITNSERRPFVLSIDCYSLQIVNCVFF